MLYAYRHEHRPVLTQARVGRWLDLTQGQVSRLERDAEPAHDLNKLVEWARELSIPERLLWFRLPERVVSARQTALVASSFGWFGTSAVRGQSTRVEHGDVTSVREITVAFRKLDNRYGGGHARSMVAGYLSTNVVPLLREGRYRHEVRRELAGAVAELGQLAGWMAYDMGDSDAGRRHLRQSLRLCQEVGDDALTAEMLAGMSHHAAFYREPLVATDLARAAKNNAMRTCVPALVAESAVMEAHGLALLRDTRGCVAALGEAERAFSAGENRDRPEWLGYFDRAYLAAKFAHCFRDLDRPVEAERYARRSLEMSEGYDRGRLFNLALLSSVLADQRRIEEACETGSRAVALASGVQSVRVTAYLVDVARRLAPYRADGRVRTLYDQMAAVGIPVKRG
ncbi:MAG TPA: XRE family transcriptional regulator [Pseudonocardiaceae bacterium]